MGNYSKLCAINVYNFMNEKQPDCRQVISQFANSLRGWPKNSRLQVLAYPQLRVWMVGVARITLNVIDSVCSARAVVS